MAEEKQADGGEGEVGEVEVAVLVVRTLDHHGVKVVNSCSNI